MNELLYTDSLLLEIWKNDEHADMTTCTEPTTIPETITPENKKFGTK